MKVQEMELNKGQLKAIERVERALKQCAKVNLAIFGKSDSLNAYNGTKYDIAQNNGSINDYFKSEKAKPIPYVKIEDYGAYRDSGADDMEYLN